MDQKDPSKKYFRESDLTFAFDKHDIVIKSDEHRFHKYLSGHGFKSVDFFVLNSERELHFIEVKNYGNRPDKEAGDEMMNNPEGFADKMMGKLEDSMRLIRLIDGYYARKFWYGWVIGRLEKWKWLLGWKVYFWLKAGEVLEGNGVVSYTLVVGLNEWFGREEQVRVLGSVEGKLMKDAKDVQANILVISRHDEALVFDKNQKRINQ